MTAVTSVFENCRFHVNSKNLGCRKNMLQRSISYNNCAFATEKKGNVGRVVKY